MQGAAFVVLAVLGIAALLGCGSPEASTSVAVGARSELSRVFGPCAPTRTAALVTDGRRYEALAAGDVRIDCQGGTLLLHVRPATRLEIHPAPSASVGMHLSYGASAFDARGYELDLGSETPLAWSFSGALSPRANPGCGDIIPICAAMSGGYASADRPGVGNVLVAFGSLRASTVTTVTP